jgi:hypothetical protein
MHYQTLTHYRTETLQPLRLVVDPMASSPPLIDLTLLKQYLAIDYADLDSLIELNLLAAITEFENATHRTIVRREHHWTLRQFPWTPYQEIPLPRGKTRAVTKIDVVVGGSVVTLKGPSSTPAGADYQEDLAGDDGGRLMPLRGGSWLSPDLDNPAPVTITFEAGWAAAEMPTDIQRALMFWVKTGIDDERTDPTKHEADRATFEALVSGWRLARWY